MKLRYLILIFSVCFLLQASFLNAFAIWGVTPNLLLVLLICYLFFYKDGRGIACAIVIGFLTDITSGMLVGVSSLGFLLISILIIELKESFNVENMVVALPVGVLSTFIFDFTYYLVYSLFGSSYAFIYWLKLECVRILYSGLLLMCFYTVFTVLLKGKRNRYRRWRRF